MSGIEINFQGGEPTPEARALVELAALSAVLMVESLELAKSLPPAKPAADDGAAVVPTAKQLSTLQAEFALAGVQLVPLADGTFVAAQGGWIRNLANQDEASAWLRKVTGKA